MAQDPLRKAARAAIGGAKTGAMAGGSAGVSLGTAKAFATGNIGFIASEAAVGATVGAVKGAAIAGGGSLAVHFAKQNPAIAGAVSAGIAQANKAGLIESLSESAYAAIENKTSINVRPYVRMDGKRVKAHMRRKSNPGASPQKAPRMANIGKKGK